MVWNRELEEGELEERLIYALLRPAVRLAMHSRLPMKEMVRLAKVAYFQELRANGLTLQETAQALDASMPTAARLSKELKRNFLKPAIEHQLPQRIEFILWAEPQSRARLHQVLNDHASEDIDSAIEKMLQKGHIRRLQGDNDVFELEAPKITHIKNDWFARIGSLNHILDNLSDTVSTRFLENKNNAFARTINFRIPRPLMGRLEAFYREVIWQSLVDFDDAARDADQTNDVRFSLFWHAEPTDTDDP